MRFRVRVTERRTSRLIVEARNREDAINQAWEQIGDEGQDIDDLDFETSDIDIRAYEDA